MHCYRSAGGATVTFGCDGGSVPTMTGTPTDSPQTNRNYLNIPTTAVNGNVAGHNSAVAQTRPGWLPIYYARMMTDSSIDTRRVWVGLTEAALGAVAVAAGPTSSTTDFIALGFDTAVNANWMCCSGDGTNYSCSSTGVAVATSTEYELTLNWRAAGTLTCTVNGTSVSKTTNLSSNATNFGIQNSITTLSGAARSILLSYFELEQN